MIDEARKLAEEVREYTAMKYAGDCKCGKCQLVPRALVERIYHTLNGTCTVAQEAPAPVAWRLTDGEGDYEYLTEEPSDQSRAWSRRYGREWEPLYASPVSSPPSEAAKAAPDREQLIECISRFDVFSTAAQVADAILDLSLSSTDREPSGERVVRFQPCFIDGQTCGCFSPCETAVAAITSTQENTP